MKARRVDSAAPQFDSRDAVEFQLPRGRKRWCESAGCRLVDCDDPLPGPRFEKRKTVLSEVPGHIRLIHRHGWYVQLIGGPHGSAPELERRREVNDIRCEVGEDATHSRDSTDGETDIGISGDREGWQAHDPHAVTGVEVVGPDCRRGDKPAPRRPDGRDARVRAAANA